MSLERYCSDKRILVQSADATAYQALRAAIANHVGAVLVEERDALRVSVTDRDLASRTIGADLDPRQTRLREVMTPRPVTLPPDATQEQAAELMRVGHVRRIPITNDGRVATESRPALLRTCRGGSLRLLHAPCGEAPGALHTYSPSIRRASNSVVRGPLERA
jgi:CBS domain-containing protein